MASNSNPRYKNGNARRKMRARIKAMGLPCAICGRPIHYDEPSDSRHPLSFVVDEIKPVGRYREWGYDNKTAAALDWDNVQPAHWICNARKGAKTVNELEAAGKVPNGLNRHPRPGSIVNLPDGNW